MNGRTDCVSFYGVRELPRPATCRLSAAIRRFMCVGSICLATLMMPSAAGSLEDIYQLSDPGVSIDQNRVRIRLEIRPENDEVRIARLANIVERIVWDSTSTTAEEPRSDTSMILTPEPTYWKIRLTDPPNQFPAALVLQLDAPPLAFGDDVVAVPDQNGVITLPAKFASVHGMNLRFEPQPHKNTVGYWSRREDTAGWNFTTERAATYDVEIRQGCGAGHGGSTVELKVGNQVLPFQTLETGHFQNFRWRHLGRITLGSPERMTLQLVPLTKPGGAVMDVREIRLVPVSDDKAAISLRRTALNSNGTRADDRTAVPDRPNVLVILTDDQGTLDAGCYGSRDLFTPRMDGLAHSGVRFTQAYAHTVCCPARAMLLTGRHPQRSGINNWTQGSPDSERGINLPHNEVTLAEALKSHGYSTGLFGKWHLGAAADAGPTNHGFDQFFGHLGGFIDNNRHFYLHRNGYHDLFQATAPGAAQRIEQPGRYFPHLVVDAATAFLEQHAAGHTDQPFFLYLPLNLPHYPEQPDARFAQFYAGHEMPRQSYGKVISTVDDCVGRVLDALDHIGARENTIILLTSDNGHSTEDYQITTDDHVSGFPKGHNYGANGGGGNTGKWRGSKATFYEGGLRVPAILSFPRTLPVGVTRDQVVTLADWMPTLLELCRVPVPSDVQLDGRSVLTTITENAPSHHQILNWQWQSKWVIREGDWKLIGDQSGPKELVSLADEPPESINHVASESATVARLLKLHDQWKHDVEQN